VANFAEGRGSDIGKCVNAAKTWTTRVVNGTIPYEMRERKGHRVGERVVTWREGDEGCSLKNVVSSKWCRESPAIIRLVYRELSWELGVS
jgi:hypothetical protein